MSLCVESIFFCVQNLYILLFEKEPVVPNYVSFLLPSPPQLSPRPFCLDSSRESVISDLHQRNPIVLAGVDRKKKKYMGDCDIPDAQWGRTSQKRDVSTGPLACPFARSLIRSHRSLVCLLWTACFARALHFAHSFARLLTLLTSLTPLLVGK